MNIKCPKCKEEFHLDDLEIAEITRQIRDAEFESEVSKRVEDVKSNLQQIHEHEKKLLVTETRTEMQAKYQTEVLDLKEKVADLKGQIASEQSKSKLAVIESESKLKEQHMLEVQRIRGDYDSQVRQLSTELDYYKDLKTKMSTKMVGETLEQHCLIEFNKIRGMLSKNVYFDKDNEVSKSGSKGDFIYREFDEDGVEIISIMFEMKNEMDATEKKHKNEDFFKELDKDRREKSCEYAILVTMLEADNDLYNCGIVDVSYQYEKMYVVRPQFFIPIITILRNAALSAMQARHELMRIQNQNIDITHFEDNLNEFKTKFAYNYTQASKRFNEAIDEIDKSISHLQKIKDALLASDRQLRLANDKADDLTVKRLCHNNPTMTERFNSLNN